MASNSRQPEWRDGVLPELDVALQFLSGAKDSCGFVPAQIALATACVLLTLIRDIMGKKQDFVDLGLFCARVCEALDRGLKERGSKDLNESVYKAIAQLTATMVEIRGKVTQKGERGWFSAFLNARGDKGAIAGWKQELTMVLDVFQTELLIGVYVVAERVERKLDVFVNQEGPHQHPPAQASILPGESPPPAPKDFFGRNDLIEEIIGRAEKLESIALIGAGGIGKTSIALTVLHSDRIKHRFGDNRRFLRCDKFPASRANFLAQLSNVIGSSIKDFPGDLTPLRPLLSSKAMILILDNAESILDPQGTDAEDIYTVVEELSQFSNICLGITSRITTIPPQFKRLNIHTLSLEAACDIFYSICGDGERSKVIDDLLQQLDCHALSIKLLATAASHNMWDHDRLAQEWRTHRAQALRTDFNKSLAASIELSLTSPTFRNLGPDARELLEVAAFFPQGINENNLDWLFPTIPNRRDIFDKFCILSLTSRSSGFITMLAPIRDYLRPQNPASSPLLRATKDHYFTRLSVDVHPEKPGFKESRWITSEDVNVEHLFNVFTPKDADSDDAWDICFHFLEHLVWHKPRRTVLGAKVEGLSNDHRSKPKCLFELARLFYEVGNWAEAKRLFTYTLQLTRQWGDDSGIAETLRWLGDVNRLLGYLEEAIHQAKGALEIRERLGDTIGQADSWIYLGVALFKDGQVDAAEDAAYRAINVVSESDQGQQSLVCESHQLLGWVYSRKRETEKAIYHYEKGLKIASAFNRRRLDEASAHISQLKLDAGNNLLHLGGATLVQAEIWRGQRRLEDAKSEALRSLEIFQSLGASEAVEQSKELLWVIEEATESHSTHVHVQHAFNPVKLPRKYFLQALTPDLGGLLTRGELVGACAASRSISNISDDCFPPF